MDGRCAQPDLDVRLVRPNLQALYGWQPRCPPRRNVQGVTRNVTPYAFHVPRGRAGGFAPDPLRSFALFQPLDIASHGSVEQPTRRPLKKCLTLFALAMRFSTEQRHNEYVLRSNNNHT